MDPWQAMDDWCAKQSQKLIESSNEQILAGVQLADPQYRCLLGQSQAFQRMRSFIHSARPRS